MHYKFSSVLILATALLLSCSSPEKNPSENRNDYELVWSDDFEYEGLPDTAKWSYDLGDGCPDLCGWGNSELQYYTQDHLKNARVEDGHLLIEAHREEYESRNYTSARLLTRDKQSWQYGRFEIRAKLPSGTGTWPASGEIDIMEHVGHEPDRVYATVHTEAYNHMNGTQDTDTLYVEDAETTFHEYAIEWTPKSIPWFVDGEPYSEFQNENAIYKEWPFDQAFHLILNIAVGGNWGGDQGVDEDIWPQQMVVDYVRVYQLSKNAN